MRLSYLSLFGLCTPLNYFPASFRYLQLLHKIPVASWLAPRSGLRPADTRCSPYRSPLPLEQKKFKDFPTDYSGEPSVSASFLLDNQSHSSSCVLLNPTPPASLRYAFGVFLLLMTLNDKSHLASPHIPDLLISDTSAS